MKRKLKIFITGTLIVAFGAISFSFSDKYFEISKNLDIFASLYRELNTYYVDETEPGELMKIGIDAMLKSLDPYTTYIPESQMEDYKIMTTGQYGGIGAIIQKRDDHVMISEPYKGFGADQAGLKAGDIILEINGKSMKGKNTSDVREILIGEPNTKISMKIKRDGEEFTKEVTRLEVKIKDVPYYGFIEDKIGYIKLTGFTSSASKETREALEKLKADGATSVVFDLRGNGGGLLREAVNIVNLFVPKGSPVVSTKGRIQEWDRTHKALNVPVDLEMPMAVLIDDGSASAAEIVSGSLQDYDRGVLIGENSFGKGLVQQPRPLSYNSTLKVTVAKYYIPSGRCIQRLDYSHKNSSGRAESVPDSLKTKFQTVNNKRTVVDGEGITPDIDAEQPTISMLLVSLYRKNLIFDYATKFQREHKDVASAKDFRLTDNDFEDFLKFIEGTEYNYVTETEKDLERLVKDAKEERYYDDSSAEFEALEKAIKEKKKDDARKFKDEIMIALEDEIVTRYYYREGLIQHGLHKDLVVRKAVDVLKNKARYDSILAGK